MEENKNVEKLLGRPIKFGKLYLGESRIGPEGLLQSCDELNECSSHHEFFLVAIVTDYFSQSGRRHAIILLVWNHSTERVNNWHIREKHFRRY